ncbi:MAG: hypothetical protein QM831_12850 [Kofleriaceae bacterium]
MATVMCVDCRQMFPPEQVDLSPNGWRCQNCKLQHDIDVHSGADEQVGTMSAAAMRAKANGSMQRGIGLVIASVVMELLVLAGAFGHERAAVKCFVGGLLIFGLAAYELIAWRRAKKAADITEQRER